MSRRSSYAPAAALLLASCASAGTSPEAGAPAPSRGGPCVYATGTAMTHLPDGRSLGEVWAAAPATARGMTDGMLPLVPDASLPTLANGRGVGVEIGRNYPAALREQGITGRTILLVWIAADGRVADVQVIRRAPMSEFDQAAVRVARAMRFRPAHADGCAVPTFLVLPVTFELAS